MGSTNRVSKSMVPILLAAAVMPAAALLLPAVPAWAAVDNLTWAPTAGTLAQSNAGGTGTWNAANTDWYDGTTSTAAQTWDSAGAIFNFATAASTVTLGSSVSATSLTFNNPNSSVNGYTFSGAHTVTLTGASPTINIAVNQTVTFSSSISSANTVVLNGGGPNVSGNNNNGGTFVYNYTTAAANTFTGAIQVGASDGTNAATLDLLNGNASAGAAYSVNIPTGNITVNDNSQLLLDAGAKANTGTGTFGAAWTNASPTINIGGFGAYAGGSINSGAIRTNGGNKKQTYILNDNVNLLDNQVEISVTSSNVLKLNGELTGGAGITLNKQAGGNLILENATNSIDSVQIGNGSMTVAAGANLTIGNVVLEQTATNTTDMVFQNAHNTIGNVSSIMLSSSGVYQAIDLGTGKLTIKESGNTSFGASTTDGYQYALIRNATTAIPGILTNGSGGSLEITGDTVNGNGTLTMLGNAAGLASSDYSGGTSIDGQGHVILANPQQTGPGSGSTTVFGSGSVTVGDGATGSAGSGILESAAPALRYTAVPSGQTQVQTVQQLGSVQGTIIVNNNGTLIPGGNGTTGSLQAGGLTLNDGSTTKIDVLGSVASGNFDTINLNYTGSTGILTLNGSPKLFVSGSGFDFNNPYTIMSYQSFAGAGTLSVDVTGLGRNLAGVVSEGANALTLTITSTVDNYLWDASGIATTAATATDGLGTWSNGVGNFVDTSLNTANTWNNATVQNAVFGTPAAGSGGLITLGNNIVVQGYLIFNPVANPYTIGHAGDATTLEVDSGIIAQNNATINANTLIGGTGKWTVDTGKTLTVNGNISEINGSQTLDKGGAGTLVLTGTNSFSGGTTIESGILNVNSDAALGSGTTAVTLSGGTLQAGGTLNSPRNIAVSGTTSTIDSNGNAVTLGGVISGTTLNINDTLGTGAVTLTNTGNSFSNISINTGGTLDMGGNDAVLGPGNINLNGGTLQTNATLNSNKSVVTGAGTNSTINTEGHTVTFSYLDANDTGFPSGSGGLNVTGGGTVFFNNGNNPLNQFYNFGALGVGAGSTLELSINTTHPNQMNVSNSGSNFSGNFILGPAYRTRIAVSTGASITGQMSGGGNIEDEFSSSVVYANSNTNNSETLTVGDNVVINPLASAGPFFFTLGAGTNSEMVVNGNISSGGTGHQGDLVIATDATGGSGMVVLAGANTYTGSTTIANAVGNPNAGPPATGSGTLRLGADNTLPSTTDLIDGFAPGTGGTAAGALDMNGHSQTVNSITGDAGSTGITNSQSTVATLTIAGSATTTFNAPIGFEGLTNSGNGYITDFNGIGSIALAITGNGKLTLGGNNSFTGGVSVSNGTLIGAATNALGAGNVSVSGTGILQETATNALADTTGFHAHAASLSVSNGTATLNFANAFSGGTIISGGSVTASLTGTLGSGTIAVNGGTLNANASAVGTGNVSVGGGILDGNTANALSGGQKLTVTSGNANLSMDNNYTGGTTVSGGTLTASNTVNSATGTAKVTISGTGTVIDNGIITGPVSLDGGTLKGNGSITGAVTIDGGTISPGLSPGLLTTGDETWSATGSYQWEFLNSALAAGTGYDLLAMGNLTLDPSLATTPFNLDLVNLGGSNFDVTSPSTWEIATTTSDGLVLPPADFNIIATGFNNSNGSNFQLTTDGSKLFVHFTPTSSAVPEPATLGVLSLGSLMLLRKRRRAVR